MSQLEKIQFIKLFNRGGYVLDFTTDKFDDFCMNSVGVKPCTKYNMSKGKSLEAYIKEANDVDACKLFSDLLKYYESAYDRFDEETSDCNVSSCSATNYKKTYMKCKEIISNYLSENSNNILVRNVEIVFSTDYMKHQIKLMLETQDTHTPEAIGKAKELLESCCKTILSNSYEHYENNIGLSELVGKTLGTLKLMPKEIDDSHPNAKSLKQICGSLRCIVGSLSELRNSFGTGHGKEASFKGLEPRHAHLAIGASITLVEFLWATYQSQIKGD